jgi:microcystin degradation protein MlrC
VLAALLEHQVQNAGVVINDSAAVARLSALPAGGRFTLPIGGASGVVGAEPLILQVELLSTSDGRFVLEDRQSHLASMYGEQIDMGPCAVLRAGGVQILLTSRRTPPFDLGQWRSQGVDPERLFAIGVKAAVAHRRAYDPIAAASFLLETPGPCASDLRTLPFQHVRRPIFPLDPIAGSPGRWRRGEVASAG